MVTGPGHRQEGGESREQDHVRRRVSGPPSGGRDREHPWPEPVLKTIVTFRGRTAGRESHVGASMGPPWRQSRGGGREAEAGPHRPELIVANSVAQDMPRSGGGSRIDCARHSDPVTSLLPAARKHLVEHASRPSCPTASMRGRRFGAARNQSGMGTRCCSSRNQSSTTSRRSNRAIGCSRTTRALWPSRATSYSGVPGTVASTVGGS